MGEAVSVGAGHTWEISTPAFQFALKYKTSLKIKSINEKKLRVSAEWTYLQGQKELIS